MPRFDPTLIPPLPKAPQPHIRRLEPCAACQAVNDRVVAAKAAGEAYLLGLKTHTPPHWRAKLRRDRHAAEAVLPIYWASAYWAHQDTATMPEDCPTVIVCNGTEIRADNCDFSSFLNDVEFRYCNGLDAFPSGGGEY